MKTNSRINHINNSRRLNKTFLLKDRFKLLLAILLSNIALYLILYEKKNEANNISHLDQFPIQKGHIRIIIPLRAYVTTLNKQNPIAISIYNDKNIVIIKKGYIIPEKIIEGAEEMRLSNEFIKKYQLEIPSEEINKIISNNQNTLSAFPFAPPMLKKQPLTKRKDYEIIF